MHDNVCLGTEFGHQVGFGFRTWGGTSTSRRPVTAVLVCVSRKRRYVKDFVLDPQDPTHYLQSFADLV